MGFVDLEFYLDRNSNIINVRSPSRLGYGELRVNCQRIETIRALFNKPKYNYVRKQKYVTKYKLA